MTLRLAPLLLLAACAGSSAPPPEFTVALARAGRGSIERRDGVFVRGHVPIGAAVLPRAAAVTIRTLQPGGEVEALEQVFTTSAVLFFARHRYADPVTPSRSVLVGDDGRVVERSFEVMATAAAGDPSLARALAAASAALGERPTRIEVVHGEPGSEWLRVSCGARSADSDLDGTLLGLSSHEVTAAKR